MITRPIWIIESQKEAVRKTRARPATRVGVLRGGTKQGQQERQHIVWHWGLVPVGPSWIWGGRGEVGGGQASAARARARSFRSRSARRAGVRPRSRGTLCDEALSADSEKRFIRGPALSSKATPRARTHCARASCTYALIRIRWAFFATHSHSPSVPIPGHQYTAYQLETSHP